MTTATLDEQDTLPADAPRSRIDGQLHRSLPADIQIREAAAGEGDDGLLRLRLSVSSETPYVRQSWWEDPWVEILGHKAGEVDLSRFQGGSGVVLGNHDRYTAVGNTPLAGIGLIESASIEGKRLVCDIVISRREALADLRQDIRDGLVRNVSIGYQINERVLTRSYTDGKPDEYRVTSWSPFEISLVDIPADATVGLGRQADEAPLWRSVPLGLPRVQASAPAAEPATLSAATNPVSQPPAAAGISLSGERSMTTAIPAAPATAATPDPLAQERQRVADLSALGRQHACLEDAHRAIESGVSVDAFRASLLERLAPAARITPDAPDAEIGMSAREIERFSFCRAILLAMDPHNAAFRKAAAFEIECSEAVRSKLGDGNAKKEREGGLTIPFDVLRSAPFGNQHAAAESAMRMLIQRSQSSAAFRDLVVGTNTAGGHLVATDLLASSFIEMFRNKARLIEMGATLLTGLVGNIAIPRQTGGASYYWVAENTAPTESQAAFDQVPMSPKTIGAFTDYSRRLLLQASLDVELFVRMDLAMSIALGVDYGGLFADGTGNAPTGVFNQSGVGAVIGGTNGAAPTWDNIVDFETQVATGNADLGSLAYVTNAKVRGKLKRTQKFSGTNGVELWQKGRDPRAGIGEVNGYDAYVTNQIPSNLTKGTSTGVCSAIGFGNWAEVVIGLWSGLDVLLDPYTNGSAGGKRVIALQDCDIAVRHGASFAVMKDALTT